MFDDEKWDGVWRLERRQWMSLLCQTTTNKLTHGYGFEKHEKKVGKGANRYGSEAARSSREAE